MNRETQKKQMFVPHVFTGVMTLSLLIFVYVGYQQIQAHGGSGTEADEQLRTILAGISAFLLTLSLFTRQWFFRMFAKSSSKPKGEPLAVEFFQALIYTLMIREVGVIVCFVCTTMTRDLNYVLYAALAAIALNILTWPREIPRR